MPRPRIISAAVTPFTADGRLDLASASRLYQHGLACGMDGFFLFGSMGEWALLTPAEQDALAEVACATIGDRARLIFGIHDSSLPRILENLRRLSRFRHSHYAVILPGGWAGAADPVAFAHRLADAADRPLFLYHLPQLNGLNPTLQQWRDILSHPRIVGLKNSAGQMRPRKELQMLKRTLDFELYEGDEWAVDEALALGHDGVIVGFASLGGRLLVAIAEAVAAGQMDSARALQYLLIKIFHQIYGENIAWWSAGQKYALAHLGIIDHATTRVESQRVLPADRQAIIRDCLAQNACWFHA